MLQLEVSEETSATPQEVIAAAHDFSPGRGRIWGNVKDRYTVVHEEGEGFAEVTEGTLFIGRYWERSRYEWAAHRVVATVKESNVLRPGSTWSVQAEERGGKTVVTMALRRDYAPNFKALIGRSINRVGGRRLFGLYLRRALQAIEERAS